MELKARNVWQGILARRAGVFVCGDCNGPWRSKIHGVCSISASRHPGAVWSNQVRGRKPSERLYKEMVRRLRQSGIAPDETLHISNDLPNDLVYARRHGFQTALYAGDHLSLRAPPEMVSDRTNRPTIVLTDLCRWWKCLDNLVGHAVRASPNHELPRG